MLSKKTVYDKLVAKVNNIDTSKFILKTEYDADKKYPDTSEFVKETGYNSKITEIESKITSIRGLASSSALAAVEKKIPDVCILIKKLTIAQKLMKLKRKLMIMIMINILIAQNLIS